MILLVLRLQMAMTCGRSVVQKLRDRDAGGGGGVGGTRKKIMRRKEEAGISRILPSMKITPVILGGWSIPRPQKHRSGCWCPVWLHGMPFISRPKDP